MQQIKYFCDICGEERKNKEWYSSYEPFYIKLYVSSQNPLGSFGGSYQTAEVNYKDVCDDCRRKLAQAIADTIIDIKNSNVTKEN